VFHLHLLVEVISTCLSLKPLARYNLCRVDAFKLTHTRSSALHLGAATVLSIMIAAVGRTCFICNDAVTSGYTPRIFLEEDSRVNHGWLHDHLWVAAHFAKTGTHDLGQGFVGAVAIQPPSRLKIHIQILLHRNISNRIRGI